MPAPADKKVGDECGNIKEANNIHARNYRHKEAGEDGDCSEKAENDNLTFELCAIEPESMDNLCDEENDDADFSGIVDGEDNVGNESCQ